MSLNLSTVAQQMLGAASQAAGSQWNTIRSTATVEIQGLARRIVLISEGVLNGELTKASAKRHLQLARFHVVATIAMLTSMVQAGVERMVNAALGVIRDTVNTTVGFVLL